MAQLLIIIPTYNEKDNITELVGSILKLPVDARILIIDDNSPDGTGTIADGLAARFSNVSVLHNPEKSGLGAAYMKGFKYALENTAVSYIMQMDADLSHDPVYIQKFLDKIEHADVVIGSRFYKGRISIVNWPIMRLVFSYCASLYIQVFARLGLSDPTGGYKCFRREVISNIIHNRVISNGYAFQTEVNYMCSKLGYNIEEVPIIFYDRDKGRSKMRTMQTILSAILIVWQVKFKRYNKIS